MRRLSLTVLACALALVPAGLAASTAPSVTVIAWSSKVAKGGLPPADAVNGGVYCKAVPFKRLYAFVRFRGMRDKVPSTTTWYFNDKRVFVFNFKWEDGPTGRTAFNLYPVKGNLRAGRYRVEVRSGGRLVGQGGVQVKLGDC
jgi:hypothetical protein